MKARRLKLCALAAAATLTAAAQRVDQIPVTQAGLVPAGGFDSVPPANKSPSDPQGAQGLVPQVPPESLSKYVVRDDKALQFRLRDIYTKQGLEDLSFREHPGLYVGNFRKLNGEAGYEMFLEDERLGNIGDFRDTALAMKVGGDPAEANSILNATEGAFLRDEYSPDPANSISDAPEPKSGAMLVNLEQLRFTWIERRF